MLYVAIVENEKMSMEVLKERLCTWKQERNIACALKIRVFSTGEDFLKSELDDYRVVFMAIKLGGRLNGIETAKSFRELGYPTPIVYTTIYKEHVFEGYHVDAIDYLIKPVSAQQIGQCMDRIMELDAAGVYTIQTKTSVQKIPYSEIMYIQSFKHYVEFHTAEKDYEQLITLSILVRKLPLPFCRCHRSVIVNLSYVKGIYGSELEMADGQHFSISASYYEEIRKCFLRK